MQNLRKIEQNVIKGFVLDKTGQWRPLGDVIAEEVEYLRHLEKGEILKNGKWIPLNTVSEMNATLPQSDSSERLLKEKPVSEKNQEKTSLSVQAKVTEKESSPDQEIDTKPSGAEEESKDLDEDLAQLPDLFEESIETDLSFDVNDQTDDLVKTTLLSTESTGQKEESEDLGKNSAPLPDIVEEAIETGVPGDMENHIDDAMESLQLATEPAEDTDSKTRPYGIDEFEPTDTSVLDRDSLGITEFEPSDTSVLERESLGITEFEPSDTSVLERESLDIPELPGEEPESEELLSSKDFESVISKMENTEIPEPGDPDYEDLDELSASPFSRQASRPAESIPLEGLDEWDKARSSKTKVFIISIGSVAIVTLLVLLKFLL